MSASRPATVPTPTGTPTSTDACAACAATSAAAPKPWLLDLLLLGALWGASFLFMRVGAREFGALPTAALRVGVATLTLLPLLALRGQMPELRQHWKPALSIGVLNSGLPFALFAYALITLNAGLGAVLNATVPMFGALVAWAWFGDRPDGSRLTGLGIGFAGVALLAGGSAGLQGGSSSTQAMWAVLACLAACLSYGLAANATRKHLHGAPALATATGSQIGATLFLALPAIWLWPTQTPSLRAWLALIALGVACTAFAYILFFRLIAHAGPQRALTVTFLVPVFAVAYGAIFLHESVTTWMLMCAGIIVCGVALSTGLVRLGRRAGAD